MTGKGGKFSRDKGRRGEQQTARELQAALGSGVIVRRGTQSRTGRDEPDLVVEGRPWWIEVKTWGSRKSWGDHVDALHQAEHACLESDDPSQIAWAVVRENRRPPMVVARVGVLTAISAGQLDPLHYGGMIAKVTWASILVWLAQWK